MNDLSKAELRSLAETTNDHCVSLYMPTHRAVPDIQQDPIRLKNLLAEAERRLSAAGLRVPEVRKLLAPAGDLVPRHQFWQNQSDGLAVFLAPGFAREYRLPFRVEELVMVGKRFHLKPILPWLAPDGRFYVLALSQNRVRLLQATRRTVEEMEVESLPQGLAEALRYDAPEPQLQFHTGSRAPGGRAGERPGVYHGLGAGTEDAKSDIRRYFHQVDDGLRDWLGASQDPLVLAGVEYLHPLYREANTYPYLVEGGIKGNPDDLRADELHAQAWDLVRPIFIAKREAEAARFRRLHGAGDDMASADLETIVPGAYYGRVETLFVDVGRKQWGIFDPDTNEVTLLNEPGPNAEDLYDLAAVQTYLNGGNVYAVTADKMPGAEPIAAVFRY